MPGYRTDASWRPGEGWLVGFPAFPNVFAAADALPDAKAQALSALIVQIGMLITQGYPVPEPVSSDSAPEVLALPNFVAARVAEHNASLLE